MPNRHLLALDLGLKCGWAMGYTDFCAGNDSDRTRLRTLSGPASGVWRLDKALPRKHPGARFQGLKDELKRIAWPDVIAYEEVRRHQGTTAAHVYGGFLAVVQAWALEAECELLPIGVTEAKKHATGKGGAKKPVVMDAMRALGHDPHTEDESDALAVWYCARERLANV